MYDVFLKKTKKYKFTPTNQETDSDTITRLSELTLQLSCDLFVSKVSAKLWLGNFFIGVFFSLLLVLKMVLVGT